MRRHAAGRAHRSLAVAQQADDRQVDVVPQAGAVPLHPAVGPLDPAIAGSHRRFGQQHDLSGETAPRRDGVDFLRQGVQILVGDPDDHPGLVDQFGDDGAQHGLRLRGALPPRQFGQQLAGDGGADPDHALALAGRRVGGALHDVFKLVGEPLQRRRQPRHRRRFGRGLAVGETVGIAVLVRLEQVGRFEDRLRRRGRFFRFGRGRLGFGINASDARRSSRRRATSASNSVSNRNLRVDVMIVF